MELIFRNFSKKTRQRGEPRAGTGGRRRARKSRPKLFWTLPPCNAHPLDIPGAKDAGVALRRRKMAKGGKVNTSGGRGKKMVAEGRRGGRREKRKVISYIRRPRCNGGYFALQNTRSTPSPSPRTPSTCPLLIPARAATLKIISISHERRARTLKRIPPRGGTGRDARRGGGRDMYIHTYMLDISALYLPGGNAISTGSSAAGGIEIISLS